MSSTSTDSEEEVVTYSCRLCPGLELKETEKEAHLEAHRLYGFHRCRVEGGRRGRSHRQRQAQVPVPREQRREERNRSRSPLAVAAAVNKEEPKPGTSRKILRTGNSKGRADVKGQAQGQSQGSRNQSAEKVGSGSSNEDDEDNGSTRGSNPTRCTTN